MPKKFGTNTKAQEAKERKDEAKRDKQDKEKKAKEDAIWAETDKHILEKERRKKEQEDKKLAEQQRKAQNKELADKEAAELAKSTTKNQPPSKVTRAEIDRRKEIEALAAKKREEKEQKEKQKAEEEIEANVNRMVAEEKAEHGDAYVEARSVGEALDKLSVDGEKVDRHLEKRMKAAFKVYEEKRMPELREDFPTLKLSQLKDVLWKEWQKSPENPYNQ